MNENLFHAIRKNTMFNSFKRKSAFKRESEKGLTALKSPKAYNKRVSRALHPRKQVARFPAVESRVIHLAMSYDISDAFNPSAVKSRQKTCKGSVTVPCSTKFFLHSFFSSRLFFIDFFVRLEKKEGRGRRENPS